MQELKIRLEKIKPMEKKTDKIVIFSGDPNFFYFTNSTAKGIFVYDGSRPILYASEMEFGIAKKSWIKDVRIYKENVIKKAKGRIGINYNEVSLTTKKRINKKCFDISKELENARAIKTSYEINCIGKACSISEKVFKKIENEIGKTTEKELKGIMEFNMNRFSSEPSFPTIVASGKNIKNPHHIPGEAKTKFPLLIDFGCKYKGYCSDITRTMGSKYEKEIENIIEQVTDIIKDGVKVSEIDLLARKLMKEKAKYFITALGHGLGIAVHEKPNISKKSKDIFKTGMVFTIEPGIYVNNGIRTENDYVLAEKGAVNLTKF